MKRSIICIILFIFSLPSCTKEIDESEIQWRNGLAYEVKKSKPFTGKVVSRYENGQKMTERKYKDGKRDGKWVTWFVNGQKQGEENWKAGEPDGKWVKWYPNGQKRMACMYCGTRTDRNRGRRIIRQGSRMASG